MKILTCFLFTISMVIMNSCTTSKLLTSNLKPSEVIDLQFFEPLSYISLIEHGNLKINNDTLSIYSQELLKRLVHDYKNKIPVTDDFFVTDHTVKLNLEKEIESLYISSNTIDSISNLKKTPIIDSLLKSHKKRFGLITVATGYTRTETNYKANQVIGLSTGILTGFTYNGPINVYSILYVFIVDADQNNIAFYRRSMKKGEPLNEDVLRTQLRNIFNHYYFREH